MEKIIAFAANERLPMDGGSGLVPGQVYLANEARFSSTYYSEPLTAYVTGWRDPNNIQATLDFLFPPVQVGRRFEFKKTDNAEAFFSELDDVRAIGADFKKVEFTGVTVNEKTLNKGLSVVVDLDNVADQGNWREQKTGMLMQRLWRNELRRASTLASASATNTAKTWDTTAGKDPDYDVLTDLIAASDESGIRPNRVLYGDVAWNKRALSHRAQNSAGGFASASLTPEQLAGVLGVDGVKVSRERYTTAPTTKGKVVPDIVLEFYAQDGATADDPSHFKRFWSPVEGGGMFRVYEQQLTSKLYIITVEHYSNLVAAHTKGVRKLTIS